MHIKKRQPKQHTGFNLNKLDQLIQIFLPVSTPMILWYFIFILTLISEYFLTIYFICFQSYRAQQVVEKKIVAFQTIIFGLDILISLNTSFIENGRIITNKKASRIKYLKSKNFILDLISFAANLYQVITSTYQPSISFIVLIKFNKVKDFDLLITKYIIRSPNVLLSYHIFKHMVLLIMVCHFIGSFFFYLDIKLIDLNWYPKQMLWVYNSYSYNRIIDLPPQLQYCYAFYYAVVTLSAVAYGDLTPLNPTQTLYTFSCLVIPLIIYAYIFSVISQAVKQRRIKILQIKQYKKIARNYFIQSGIDEFTVPKFVNYLSNVYQKKVNFDNNFINSVAPSIKQMYIRSAFQNNFDFSIFQPMIIPPLNMECIKQIITSIGTQEVYPAKQLIYSHKSKKPKLYFIVQGQVSQIICRNQRKFTKFIDKNNFFDHYYFFTGLAHSDPNHMFQTKKFTICQTIYLSDFLKNTMTNSAIYEFYHKFRNQLIFNKKINEIKLKCFFCQEQDHIIDYCDKLKVTVDPIQCSCRHHSRQSNFIRKNRRSIKKYGNIQAIKLLSKFIDSLTQKQQKLTQTQDIKDQNTDLILLDKKMEKVQNWNIFEPSFSLN